MFGLLLSCLERVTRLFLQPLFFSSSFLGNQVVEEMKLAVFFFFTAITSNSQEFADSLGSINMLYPLQVSYVEC